jgi:hypothetical protein
MAGMEKKNKTRISYSSEEIERLRKLQRESSEIPSYEECELQKKMFGPRSNPFDFDVKPPALQGTSGYAQDDADFEDQFEVEPYHRQLKFADNDPILHEVKDLKEGDHFRNQVLLLCKNFRERTGMCMYKMCMCMCMMFCV